MTTVSEEQLTRLRFPGLIAMDVSGTSITTAVCGFDEEGRLKVSDEDQTIEATPVYDTKERARHQNLVAYFEKVLVARIANALRGMLERNPAYDRLPVGISVSGQVSPEGDIYSASSIFRGARPPRETPLNLGTTLTKRYGFDDRKFLVLNNVSAAAWCFSLDREIVSEDVSQFLVVHVGSGFGSKVFDVREQRVLLDDKGLASEIGHVRVDPVSGLKTPPLCDCGKAGHLASYFLPEGLALLCRHFAKLCTRGHPTDSRLLQELKDAEAAEFIKALYADRKHRHVAQQILDFLAQVLASSLSQVTLTVGVDRIVLKGRLFHLLGQKATTYFTKELKSELGRRLGDYLPVSDKSVLLRAFPNTPLWGNVFELHDRQFSLAGLAACAAATYRMENGVSSGYFGRNPCFTLSCANPIRYPVIRSSDIFDLSNPLLRELTAPKGVPRKLLVVIDEFLDILQHQELGQQIRRYFRHHGRVARMETTRPAVSFETVDVIICRLNPVQGCPPGPVRENKTPEQVDQVVSWCQQFKLPRDGMLVAVGGGVILDIVGFAAQQYRRMVSYVRIPTTLIGQVDAGVGVKVGVNYGASKNLIGAFYPPYATVNDPLFLCDLEPRQLECGLAEIIKMGIIAEAEIVEMLERLHQEKLQGQHPGLTGELLRKNAEILNRLVEISDHAILSMMKKLQENITEQNLKRLVDFGHTFSPKIESLSNYRIPHGYAVAIDMYLSCFISHRLGRSFSTHTLIDATLFDRYERLLRNYRLLIAPYLDQAPLLQDRRTDLFDGGVDDCICHRGGNLNLVVPLAGVDRGGFVNLSPFAHSRSKDYAAIVSRADLRALFELAMDSLYVKGTREDF